MTIFDQTETRFDHSVVKLVKYDNKTLVIGGDFIGGDLIVEELNRMELTWAAHPMSPIGFDYIPDFTALTVETSLFIFGRRSVVEWNGTSWKTLEEARCRRVRHTTFVYAGEIYHMGGFTISEKGERSELFR